MRPPPIGCQASVRRQARCGSRLPVSARSLAARLDAA